MTNEVTDYGCGNLISQPYAPDSKSGAWGRRQSDRPSKNEKRAARYERPRRARIPGTRRLEDILLTAQRYRVVDREIIQLLHFTDGGHTLAQSVLTQCWWAGFLDKLRNRPRNARDVYFVSGRAGRGLQLLDDLLGEEAVRRRLKRPPAIDHALAVNRLRARIEVSCRKHGLSVENWMDELDLAGFAREGIVPDASFQILRREEGHDRRAGFFLEAELAPVSRQHWHDRFAKYASFYRSGGYEAAFGLRSLRVLVVTRGHGRQQLSILEEAERLNFTPLRLTTYEEVRETQPGSLLTAPLWRKPFDNERGSLYSALPNYDEEVMG